MKSLSLSFFSKSTFKSFHAILSNLCFFKRKTVAHVVQGILYSAQEIQQGLLESKCEHT